MPVPWLFQSEAGTKILITLSGWLGANAQALLEVDEDGAAQGRFLPGYRSFMMARSMQAPPEAPMVFHATDQERDTEAGADVLDDWTGRFVAQLAAPGATPLAMGDERGLRDISTGSWCLVGRTVEGGWRVREHGPVRLWDLVEESVAQWRAAGSPHLEGFGLTVTPAEQRVWLGSPDGPSWRLPV